jgi:hypothetical protein
MLPTDATICWSNNGGLDIVLLEKKIHKAQLCEITLTSAELSCFFSGMETTGSSNDTTVAWLHKTMSHYL